ncbi:MAG: plasmid maintenance system killer protein [Spirochaetaceae bacterium]|nr:plasmid maintenance system killer protein [Spirochaetaceae bacterium]
MIKSFRDSESEKLFRQELVKRIPRDVQRRALIKLMLLDAAEVEKDLESPPGNRLKKLKGGRKAYFSIRVNDQWRITFQFKDGHAFDVAVEDYH